ncbi:MAG: hypothetical protein QM442_02755, partial [Spirochaetota bacterium]|nr:hypothetical protein [Spirochaetota bacterium]
TCSASYAVIRDFVSHGKLLDWYRCQNYIPPFGSSQQEVEKKETFGASNIRLEGDEKTSHPEVTCVCWNR